MSKYSFLDDYSEGCHPKILKALSDTNFIQQTSYGNDEYSKQARELIGNHFDKKDIEICFVAGGTLANIISISSILKPYEAIISVESGHIVSKETGAIEATGHKIITADSKDGKLTPESIKNILKENSHYPHNVKPRLIYISNATELGTIYSKAELESLYNICKENHLYLFLDGARLGSALTAKDNNLTLADIANLTDIFWIGGTKSGVLFGEAIVIPNKKLAYEFDFNIKQKGALLAKGRALGLQFRELFSDNLFFELTKHSNDMAQKLSKGIINAGYNLLLPAQSNQIFAIFPNSLVESLQEKFVFFVIDKINDKQSIVRLVTSWATKEEKVNEFLQNL